MTRDQIAKAAASKLCALGIRRAVADEEVRVALEQLIPPTAATTVREVVTDPKAESGSSAIEHVFPVQNFPPQYVAEVVRIVRRKTKI